MAATQASCQGGRRDRLGDAIHARDLKALCALLECGRLPDAPLPGGETPLMAAAALDWAEGTECLLARGADPDAQVPGKGTPLTAALGSRKGALLARLLEAGADPGRVPPGIQPSLAQAVVLGQERAVRLLLAAGAEPGTLDRKGWPVLRLASDLGQGKLIPLLIEAGARPEAPCPDGWTPLLAALHGLQEDAALAMLEAPDPDVSTWAGPEGTSALGLAASGGLAAAAVRLLALGHPVDGFDPSRGTPLHRAVLFGEGAMALKLLAAGASLAEPDAGASPDAFATAATMGMVEVLEAGRRQGRNPLAQRVLEAAVRGLSLEVLDWLVAQGFRADTDTGTAFLQAAALAGRAPLVARLLSLGADPLAPDTMGRTALSLALEEESGSGDAEDRTPAAARLATVRALLDGGAFLEAEVRRDPERVTRLLEMARPEVLLPLLGDLPLPLPGSDADEVMLLAASRDLPELVWALVKRRHRLDLEGGSDGPPVRVAARFGHGGSLRALLEAGAEPDRTGEDGCTALMVASGEGHLACVRLLVEAGANLDRQDGTGWTALHAACEGGHREVVAYLLGQGARRDVADAQGQTPQAVARLLGHQGVARLCRG